MDKTESDWTERIQVCNFFSAYFKVIAQKYKILKRRRQCCRLKDICTRVVSLRALTCREAPLAPLQAGDDTCERVLDTMILEKITSFWGWE